MHVEPHGSYSRVLKEFGDVIAGSLLFFGGFQSLHVPMEWKLANLVTVFKKGKKEDPGNYRPASLTSVPGKTTEKVILRASYQVLGGISWTTCSEVANIWDSLGLN